MSTLQAIPGVLAPDWRSEAGRQWLIEIGRPAQLGARRAVAFTWKAPVPQGRDAVAMAHADMLRAFAVHCALRGVEATLARELTCVLGADPDDNGDAPFFEIGAPLRGAIKRLGTVRKPARDPEHAADHALRAVAALAAWPEGKDVALERGHQNDGDKIDWRHRFSLVSCAIEPGEDGVLLIGDAEDDLAMPEPLRAVAVALSVAQAVATGSQDHAVLQLPASATLRAALRAELQRGRVDDALAAAHFLRQVGLPRDAEAFLAAYGRD